MEGTRNQIIKLTSKGENMSTVEFTFEGLFIFEHNAADLGALRVNVVTGITKHIASIEITETNSASRVKIITPIDGTQISKGVDISIISNPPSNPPWRIGH